MPKAFSRAITAGAVAAVSMLSASSAGAETLFHRAENQVPMAIVQIDRTSAHTEIRLQAQAALTKVCFAATGPSSPYLLASGRNYRYLGGDNVSTCPERRDYAVGDVLVLRFESLAAGNSTFSFVSGQGGEKQSIDAVAPSSPYWNLSG
ncbi:MAG TPA: hypothetical protein VFP79_13970 [Pseudolabrys sp.]|nr:hypothetical protein [Pseudolabrys sp.]